MDERETRSRVRKDYGSIALNVLQGSPASCCGSSSCCTSTPISTGLYGQEAAAVLPQELLTQSLGCGNPVALEQLQPGEIVLDLGCGGGLDTLLAAHRVGPSGRAYGLDMTLEMLRLAQRNRDRVGLAQVYFLAGELEALPLASNTIDCVISNCVFNLSPNKSKALAEAYRVLKPGGRLAISDILRLRPIPERLRQNPQLWSACLAGAMAVDELQELLAHLGFIDRQVQIIRTYQTAELDAIFQAAGLSEQDAAQFDGEFFASAFIRAVKPA